MFKSIKNSGYCLDWLAAILIPLAYLVLYTPYGMDSTDFGYFYGYGWRILQGQIPYRDFYYIKPALPLYWHALWMWLTPDKIAVLAGKAGFIASMLATSWLAALYLKRVFRLGLMGLSTPLLAVCGFVWGVHTFPHMPWHTADGILFSSGALLAAISGHPILAGLLAALATLCKQSFILVSPALFLLIWVFRRSRREAIFFALSVLCALLCWFLFLFQAGAWSAFVRMTTGQLAMTEALDAGIGIYLRQNWLLPLAAILPGVIFFILRKKIPGIFLPCYLYLPLLCAAYIAQVLSERAWTGYGTSWPTLFVLLGGICVLFPGIFLTEYLSDHQKSYPRLRASLGLGLALLVSWSVAISGGYKIPALFAVPLLLAFFLIHARLGGNVRKLAWLSLFCALLMFAVGYQYPYVFPSRDMPRSSLVHDAGAVYAKANGVKVDADMLARLSELKALRAKYGPNYKTMPGFSFAYWLNGDKPVYRSDWLIDWEINAEIDELYKELLDKNLLVFMERDQLDSAKADAYDRAGYSVPQRVRREWKIIDQTPHFVVFQAPNNLKPKPKPGQKENLPETSPAKNQDTR